MSVLDTEAALDELARLLAVRRELASRAIALRQTADRSPWLRPWIAKELSLTHFNLKANRLALGDWDRKVCGD